MKRYLLFAGQYYYPGGGWADFIGSYDAVAEAEAEGAKRRMGPRGVEYPVWDWFHVIDATTGAWVVGDKRLKVG
jgi:hypothetical protein